MAFYKITVPSKTATGYNIKITIGVDADNWLSALTIALENLGEGTKSLRNVECSGDPNESLVVIDKTSGRIFQMDVFDSPPRTNTGPLRAVQRQHSSFEQIKRQTAQRLHAFSATSDLSENSDILTVEHERVKTFESISEAERLKEIEVDNDKEWVYKTEDDPEIFSSQIKAEIKKIGGLNIPAIEKTEELKTHVVQRNHSEEEKPVVTKLVQNNLPKKKRQKSENLSAAAKRFGQSLTENLFFEILRLKDETNDLYQFLELTLEILEEFIPCDIYTILFSHNGGRELYYVATRGGFDNKFKTLQIPIEDGIVGLCVQEGFPKLCNDPQTSDDYSSRVEQHLGIEIHTLCCAPIIHDARVYGAIEVFNSERGEFTEEELKGLRLVATHIGEYMFEQIMATELRA